MAAARHAPGSAPDLRASGGGAGADFELHPKEFETIARIIYSDAGIHLPESKSSLVYARLTKRLRQLQLRSFAEYCALVSGDGGADERKEMLSALTTNVTHFFREGHHFDHMRDTSLPALVERARQGGRVRLWSAACSTGQEAYSMAITLLTLEPKARNYDIRILASDIDPQVVRTARAAQYHERDLNGVSGGVRDRWFKPVKGAAAGTLEVAREAQELISFRELNFNGPWPMRQPFDIVFCRNVVIYFDTPTQHKAWTNLARVIPSGGWLYIGHSERLSGPAEGAFANIGTTTYKRK